MLRWCSDRAEQKKHCARNPWQANLSSPLFSCTSVLAACCVVIVAYSSLLATILMVLRASRSSTYGSPGILLLIACYTSTFSPVVLAEDIVTRRSLHDVTCTLLPLFYWQLASHCYLFAFCSPITAWLLLLAGWTPSFWLLAPHRSPHVCSMLTTCQSLYILAARSDFLLSTRRRQIVVPSS